MKRQVLKGTTSLRLKIFIADSSSTTGAGLTGLVYNSASLVWYYHRDDSGDAGGTSVTLATATRGTYTSGGFKEIDATNMPGWYEIGVPNAAVASGSNVLIMHLKGATNMAPLPIELELVSYDPNSATSLGLSNLDAAITSRLAPTTAGRTLDVSSGGEAGIDWANVGSPSTTVSLSGTTVGVSTTLTNAPSDSSGTTTLLSRLTATRAGYLDNLSDGAVALASGVIVTTNNDKTGYALSGSGVSAVQSGLATSTEVTAIQNNTRVVRSVPSVIERPDSGTQTYRIELFLYDAVGNMEAPDSAPTIALVDQGGTDLSSRLDSTTMTLVSTGKYRAIYTASNTDDLEQLKWEFSVVEGGATRVYGNDSVIVDTTAVDFTSTDRTKLTTLYDDWLNGGRLDLILDARSSQTSVDSLPSDVWNFNGVIGANSIGGRLEDCVAEVETLYMDWVNGGRLDLILDSINTGIGYLPSVTAGQSGGLLINGSNTGNLTVTGKWTVTDGVEFLTSTTNRDGFICQGNGTGNGVFFKSGTGSVACGLRTQSYATDGHGLGAYANGGGNGFYGWGGTTTGQGMKVQGGATSGKAFEAISVSGDSVSIQSISTGHGLKITAQGTSKNAVELTPGSGGTGINGTLYGLLTSSMQAIADTFLGRRISGGASTGRTVGQALATIRNKVSISGTTLTVYDVDDTTPLYTATITSSSTAEPITGIDPE